MEYRRRKQTGYQPKHGGAYPAYIAVFFIFFGIVYLISASAAGTWVAKNWIAPIFKEKVNDVDWNSTIKTPAPAVASPDTTAMPADRQVSFTAPVYICYGLQIGVYENTEHALAQSVALQKIGAAGYILPDGNRYRVLAAGYPDEASVKSVADQLLQEGIESRTYVIKSGSRKLTVSASEDVAAAMETAVQGMTVLLEHFYNQTISLDKGETTLPSAISLIRQEVKTRQATLAISENAMENQTEVYAVGAFYKTVEEICGGLPESGGQAESTALFKHGFLEAVMAYCAYTQSA